ncbi:MAG TPA: UbiA family prenyltransferase [Lacipirellulaceae bacterium]|jgi:4-hydroxybenzoate polyprenyltransferase|nr:UbiA family prenyltransferase [Lacipirellulaceae bacterium]
MTRRITAWLQLLRLPNVFTAVADVTMGYLVTHTGEFQPATHFALLVATSCLLYLSGMVLNDVFDAEVDLRERPDRPIPSGRVSIGAATIVGWSMLASGIALSWFLTYAANDWRPGAVASILAVIVLMYDGALKRSGFAPLLMGECRFLNVLLGMSLFFIPWGRAELLIAFGIGTYITGVTIFARTDARVSDRSRLGVGFVILCSGIAMLAAAPELTNYRPPLNLSNVAWYLLWAALATIIVRRCVLAIFDPVPSRVQAAVRQCVQSIIVLDAALCVGYAGTYWGFVVLSFLIPTFLLTQWLNAT